MPRYTFRDLDTITDEQGHIAFAVERIPNVVLRHVDGADGMTIRDRGSRSAMDLVRDGEVVATIHKALITPLRSRFVVVCTNGDDLLAEGDVQGHEYTVRQDDTVRARVAARLGQGADTFGVDVPNADDAVLMLAVVVALDELVQDAKER